MKKFFNIPIIVPPPPSPESRSNPASPFEALKNYISAQAMQQRAAGKSKPRIMNHTITSSSLLGQRSTSEQQRSANERVSSSSDLSLRTKSLKNKVKGRKKNKRRWVCIVALKFMALNFLIMMGIYQIVSNHLTLFFKKIIIISSIASVSRILGSFPLS